MPVFTTWHRPRWLMMSSARRSAQCRAFDVVVIGNASASWCTHATQVRLERSAVCPTTTLVAEQPLHRLPVSVPLPYYKIVLPAIPCGRAQRIWREALAHVRNCIPPDTGHSPFADVDVGENI